MNKTTFCLYVNEDTEEVETDLTFDTAINLAMSKVPIAAYDHLYEPKEIIAIDLTEQVIELKCIVI